MFPRLVLLVLIPVGIYTYASLNVNPNYQKRAVNDCQIAPTNDLSPIVVLKDKSTYLYPDNNQNSLIFSPGQSLNFICPGSEVLAGSDRYRDIVTATCVKNSEFQINRKHVHWRDVSCSKVPSTIAIRTQETCEDNGIKVKIGVGVTGRFMQTYSICFNTQTQEALYSHIKIPQSINKRSQYTPRPNWMEGSHIFNFRSVDSYYKRNNQRSTINNLLGLPRDSTNYIQNNDYFLSRGHLTAKSDTFYPSQQNQTFYLVNAAPQWQIINKNNWSKIESSTRDYAESRKVDLLQWTGTYGILAPKNSKNQPTPLHLYDQNRRKYLPVPKVFWKVVYEPSSKKGVAIIGLNDPYASSYAIFCTDISNQVSWIRFDRRNSFKGLIYVCEVNDFRRTVTYLPAFQVTGILL
ncbi:salivary endonuclease-like [Rhynchophorus ferrugineus]|uniref:salivary endonuclease-like n=1 Tax=Rhynchophorus ferrugineus TaxID=354439 RepID=UPI003FCDD48F